jgi:hypothetical protein
MREKVRAAIFWRAVTAVALVFIVLLLVDFFFEEQPTAQHPHILLGAKTKTKQQGGPSWASSDQGLESRLLLPQEVLRDYIQ